MTLNNQVMECWEYYDTGDGWESGSQWDVAANTVSIVNDPVRTGSKAAHVEDDGINPGPQMRKSISVGSDDYVYHFCAVNRPSGSVDADRGGVFYWYNTAGVTALSTTGFQFNNSGNLLVFEGLGSNYNVVYTSPDVVFTQDTYVAVLFQRHIVNGSWSIYVDGELLATDEDGSAFQTSTSPNAIGYGGYGSGFQHAQYYLDDVFAFSGGSSNFPVSLEVRYIVPDEDSSSPADFSITGVTDGYEALDNLAINTGEYIESDMADEESRFEITDSSDGIADLYGVCHVYNAQKTDAASIAGSIQGSILSGGTESLGTETALTSATYTRQYDYYTQDPNTSLDWLPPALDALQTQYERTL